MTQQFIIKLRKNLTDKNAQGITYENINTFIQSAVSH
jgi:hypothetical protein